MAGQLSPNSYGAISSLYNPRMASLHHGVEEPGDVKDIRLVVDTIPTLAWSAGPNGSAPS
jgi:hypothetical protein